MLNYINIRDVFTDCDNSYDVIKKLKRYERCGANHVYVSQFKKIAIRWAMHLIIEKSQEGYSLEDTAYYLRHYYS